MGIKPIIMRRTPKSIFRQLVIVTCCFLSQLAFSQKNFSKDADRAFRCKEYFEAVELYKQAYKHAKTKEAKARIFFMTAESYRMIGDAKQCETWYSKADKVHYPDPKTILYLADAKKAQGKYNEALANYTRYAKEVPADDRGKYGVKSCELAENWKENQTRYVVENMAMINSRESDFGPTYASKKYTTLYFTTTRDGLTGGKLDGGNGQNFSDIVETKRDKNGRWSVPLPIAIPNTKDNDGATFVSRNGRNMYFTRCVVNKNQETNCQLFVCVKKGNVWGDEIKLPFSVDSFAFGHPALDDKESIIIFSSDMPGGYGGKDLWYSLYDKKTKSFGTPVNLGKDINTWGDEMYPFLHEDGSLYFSSNGHLGMGGRDIFKASSKGNNKWNGIENMKAPINSAADDFGIIFEGNRERGYFASNREGGKGRDDIYSFVMPPLNFILGGTVSDCMNNVPLEGVTIRLMGSDGTNIETKTDKEGKYEFADAGNGVRYINMNTSYIITTDASTTKATIFAEKYLNNLERGKITTLDEKDSKKFIQDFCLIPSIIEIPLPAIEYDYNSATLRKESKDSLDYLYKVLTENSTMIVELAANTDCRGSAAYNLKLSQARAQSCVDYLIKEKGIPAERLVAKGYGEDRPLKMGGVIFTEAHINSIKTEDGREDAHQKNRRTSFRVLSWEYVDPMAPKTPPLVKPKIYGQEEGYEEETDNIELPNN